MKFAPKILHIELNTAGGLSQTISSDSVIIWGILIAHDDTANNHSVRFKKADGTAVFSVTVGSSPVNITRSMDIAFLVDAGLTVETDATTDTLHVIVFLSNPGA